VIFLQPDDAAFTTEIPQGVDHPLELVPVKTGAPLDFDGSESCSRLLGEEIENALPRGFRRLSYGWGILFHGWSG
jgi:hypothetical protein